MVHAKVMIQEGERPGQQAWQQAADSTQVHRADALVGLTACLPPPPHALLQVGRKPPGSHLAPAAWTCHLHRQLAAACWLLVCAWHAPTGRAASSHHMGRADQQVPVPT